ALGPVRRLVTLEAGEAGAGLVRACLSAERSPHPDSEVGHSLGGRANGRVELEVKEGGGANPFRTEGDVLTAGQGLVVECGDQAWGVGGGEGVGAWKRDRLGYWCRRRR